MIEINVEFWVVVVLDFVWVLVNMMLVMFICGCIVGWCVYIFE